MVQAELACRSSARKNMVDNQEMKGSITHVVCMHGLERKVKKRCILDP
jgi:hypothetical protein